MRERLKIQVWIYGRDKQGRNRILLLRTKRQRGRFWQPVTGSVEKGETFAEAALREAQEETALPFRSKPRPLGFEFTFRARREICRERVFVLRAPQGMPMIRLDSHEHEEARWVSARRAKALLKYESNREALQIVQKNFLKKRNKYFSKKFSRK